MIPKLDIYQIAVTKSVFSLMVRTSGKYENALYRFSSPSHVEFAYETYNK